MTNAINLEVGQWVELNNGERHEVFSCNRKDLLDINDHYYLPSGRSVTFPYAHKISVARILPHIKLPNGDVLFEGDWAKRRDGKVVGPLKHEGGPDSTAPWCASAYYYFGNGTSCLDCSEDDLIARAEPPQEVTDSSGCVLCDLGVCDDCDGTPKLWRDMTDAEKGALLLAEHDGKVIEKINWRGEWVNVSTPNWSSDNAYRIKPEPAKPKQETVVLYGWADGLGEWVFASDSGQSDTHSITLTILDGEVQDTAKVEKLT